MAVSADSEFAWDFFYGYEFQCHLDWVCQDAVAFELLGWHDQWFAAENSASSFVELVATAPAFLPYEIFADSILRMIASFSPDLCPLGTQRTYKLSGWFSPSFCPTLPDCVHNCLLCQNFWYRRLHFLKSCWEAGVISLH
ncbi:unnamed protein product [Calypogeia fissa]